MALRVNKTAVADFYYTVKYFIRQINGVRCRWDTSEPVRVCPGRGSQSAVPDFEASVVADYFSEFSPSPAAGPVQHLAQPPQQRLLQQADPGAALRTLRHGERRRRRRRQWGESSTIKVLLLALHLVTITSRPTVLFPGRRREKRHYLQSAVFFPLDCRAAAKDCVRARTCHSVINSGLVQKSARAAQNKRLISDRLRCIIGKLFILLCLYERERRWLCKSLAVGGQETHTPPPPQPPPPQ